MSAREQIVEALGLDSDYLDADEYPFDVLIDEVRSLARGRDEDEHDGRPTLHDALVEGLNLDGTDEPVTDNTIIETILNIARERNAFEDLLSRSLTVIHKRANVVLDARAPVPDLVANEVGKTWPVVTVVNDAFDTTITMRAPSGKLIDKTVPRDARIPVLAPIPMRDGLVLLRGGAGAQLIPIEDTEPVAEPDEPIEGAWRDGQVHMCPLVPQPHVALRDCVRYALDHGDERFVGDPTFVPENTKEARKERGEL